MSPRRVAPGTPAREIGRLRALVTRLARIEASARLAARLELLEAEKS